MTDGGDIDNNKKTPGLKAGDNVLFNNPWTFLPPGTTAQRPIPAADMYYRLRFNIEVQLYEYYDAILGAWTQLQESLFTAGPFIIYEADPSIPDGQNLGALANGILKQTITLGVATLDIAVEGVDYYGPDANNNLAVNNLIPGFIAIPTAAGTTTLTVGSAGIQEFTGSTTQTVVMPVVSTLVPGQQYLIINNSSGNVTVNSSGGNAIQVMAPNTSLYLTCILNTGTTAASWNRSYIFENGAGVLSVAGTANQIDVSAATGNVIFSLSSTMNLPGTFNIQSTTAVDEILDEDNMVSDSSTALATQQSIKAYVDSRTLAASVVVQTFSSNGTYTPTTGMKYCTIECIGPGAGGGGSASSGAIGTAGGGGAGGYSRKTTNAATIGASQVVTVGTGGAGGAAGNNNGSAGSSPTSVGSICVANAGSPGLGSAANGFGTGGNGGAAGTGDVTAYGNGGSDGEVTNTSANQILQGRGGAGWMGGGPIGQTAGVSTGGQTPQAGQSYGAGGNGAGSANSSANLAGAAGANGFVIITEYVSV